MPSWGSAFPGYALFIDFCRVLRNALDLTDYKVIQAQMLERLTMHNPPHPGEFIQFTYMEPFGISCRFLAQQLDVAASTLNRILKGQSGISPEMALRLSIALGRTPESWLAMQDAYDLWQARKHVQLGKVQKLDLDAA